MYWLQSYKISLYFPFYCGEKIEDNSYFLTFDKQRALMEQFIFLFNPNRALELVVSNGFMTVLESAGIRCQAPCCHTMLK